MTDEYTPLTPRIMASALRRKHPDMTLDAIAYMVGYLSKNGRLSRERVRQVLNDQGLSTASVRTSKTRCACGRRKGKNAPTCIECKSPKVRIACSWCGGEWEERPGVARTRSRNRGYTRGRRYCSRECVHKAKIGVSINRKYPGVPMSLIGFKIPRETHTRFRNAAYTANCTMTSVFLDAVDSFIESVESTE